MKLPLSLFVLCLLNLNIAFACRCENPNSVQKEFENSEVVVLARVAQITPVELCETMDADKLMAFEEQIDDWGRKLLAAYTIIKVEMEVVRSYKGKEVGETLTLYTAASANTCGYYEFEENRSFLIYADDRSYLYQMVSGYKPNSPLERKDSFWTSHCKRTTGDFVAEIRELEQLI